MKLIVVDTSVFVSALLHVGGASREVIRRCLLRDYVPLMGAALFAEYESLVSRERVFKNCALAPFEREALFEAFLSVCKWTRIYYTWRPNLRDEADNHVVELAIAGGAQVIVTKNIKDFTNAQLQLPGLRVVRPEQLIKE